MNKKNKGVSMISLLIVVAIGIIILVGGVYIIKNVGKGNNSAENLDSNKDTTMVENSTIESNNVNDKNENLQEKTEISSNITNWQIKYVTVPQKAKEVTADSEEFTELRQFLIDLGQKGTTQEFLKESINKVSELNKIIGVDVLENQTYSEYEYLVGREEQGMMVATDFDIKNTYYTLSLSRDKKENYVGIRIAESFRIGEGEKTREDLCDSIKEIGKIFKTSIMEYSENVNVLNELTFAKNSDIKENEYNRINYSINKGADKLEGFINVQSVEKGLAYVDVEFEYKVALNAQ